MSLPPRCPFTDEHFDRFLTHFTCPSESSIPIPSHFSGAVLVRQAAEDFQMLGNLWTNRYPVSHKPT